ncbi:PilZ domain-containing protein [Desulfospira joergensenii]|uniref:PilZ domain-containing protein n=1 Tax=Desulfospira joergensenii TaxID=53329 RepID=UPI0003B45812|nr:PilZ domain-containing protein [Desulfospira joergensenii]
MTASDEKRRHPRVGFSTRILVVLSEEGRQVELEGSSKDLSLRGVFVNTDRQFDKGTPCSVKIYLSGGIEEVELLLEGTLVRQTEKGIGVVFDSMDVDTYAHLKNIVMYNSADDSA